VFVTQNPGFIFVLPAGRYHHISAKDLQACPLSRQQALGSSKSLSKSVSHLVSTESQPYKSPISSAEF
jgi:hypothetical protein